MALTASGAVTGSEKLATVEPSTRLSWKFVSVLSPVPMVELSTE